MLISLYQQVFCDIISYPNIKGYLSILKLKCFQESGGSEGSEEAQVCESTGLKVICVPLTLFIPQCTDYLEGKNTFHMWILVLYFSRLLDHLMSTYFYWGEGGVLNS